MPAEKGKGEKPGLAIILGGAKPKGDEPNADDAAPDEDEAGAESDAMSEFISAVGAKDTGRAVEAFKVLKDLCRGAD